MKIEFLFDIIFLMLALYLIIDIYQKSIRTFIKISHYLLLLILASNSIRVSFVYFYNKNLYFGISVFLIIIVILYLINLKKIKQIIYYASIVTTIIFYIYMLIYLLISVHGFFLTSILFSKFIYSLFLAILILYVVVFVIKIRFLLPSGHINIVIIFISVSLLSLELLMFDQIKNSSINCSAYIVIYIVIGLIFFSNNIIIQYLYNDFHQLTTISQNNLFSKITDSYIQGIHNEQEKVFKIRHDIKNNLIILQHLINNNQIAEANQVIDEINNHLKYKKSDVYTGNIFIDAYLTNVIINSQMDIQIKCNDLKDLHYKPDVISIIINLVDNAVENANHFVNIQIKHKNLNCILIKVSNDCEHDPSKHLKKSKKQGDHGYGLRIVKDVVNQYQGTYITSYQNKMFTTYVMLNLEENDEK